MNPVDRVLHYENIYYHVFDEKQCSYVIGFEEHMMVIRLYPNKMERWKLLAV